LELFPFAGCWERRLPCSLESLLVEKLFNKADVDHDGTLSVQELKSKSAHTLKRLID
jgi:EF hand